MTQNSHFDKFHTDPAVFEFGTKAGTLSRLKPLVKTAELPDQVVVDLGTWHDDRDNALETITNEFRDGPLVVRSSAISEDASHDSKAGAFLSLIGISPEADAIAVAVDEVIASFGDNCAEHEVLVQPMIQDVVFSGVVLSRDLDTGGPYIVINYDNIEKEQYYRSLQFLNAK